MGVIEFLEQLQAEQPAAAADVTDMASMYQRKLWYPLTCKLDFVFGQPAHPLNSGDVPLRLFSSFIVDFGAKINLYKFAQFAVHATKSLASPQAMVDHLLHAVQLLEDMKLAQAKEPILFLRMHVAQHKLELVSVCCGGCVAVCACVERECLHSGS